MLLFLGFFSFGVKDSRFFSAFSTRGSSLPILDTPMSCEEPGLMLFISSNFPEQNLFGSSFGFRSSGNLRKTPLVGFESSFFSDSE